MGTIPFCIEIDSFPSEMQCGAEKLIMQAISAWGRVTGVEFTAVDGSCPDCLRLCYSEINDASEKMPLAAFRSAQSIGNSYGEISFNGKIPPEIWMLNPPPYAFDTDIDFYQVALHELGHALGFKDSYDDRSVMGGGDTKARTFSVDDLAMIRHKYNVGIPIGLVCADGLFDFFIDGNMDLFWIHKTHTGTDYVEVSILPLSEAYAQCSRHYVISNIYKMTTADAENTAFMDSQDGGIGLVEKYDESGNSKISIIPLARSGDVTSYTAKIAQGFGTLPSGSYYNFFMREYQNVYAFYMQRGQKEPDVVLTVFICDGGSGFRNLRVFDSVVCEWNSHCVFSGTYDIVSLSSAGNVNGEQETRIRVKPRGSTLQGYIVNGFPYFDENWKLYMTRDHYVFGVHQVKRNDVCVAELHVFDLRALIGRPPRQPGDPEWIRI